MERDKATTRARIMRAAKEEFLEHGYERASLRAIARRVGVSATAIYRHFDDKEALFSALVEPDVEGMLRAHAAHDEEAFDYLKGDHPSDLWRLSELEFMESLGYVYDHYDAFKLLLCCSEGTKLHDFQHALVNDQVESLLHMSRVAKAHGIAVNPVDAAELHLIMSGFFSSVFEMVIHDYDKAQAMRCGRALARFFNAGISTVLGF